MRFLQASRPDINLAMAHYSRMAPKRETISTETNVAAAALSSSSSSSSSSAALPKAVLDTLASRFRLSSAILVVLDRDGAVTYHDASASPFFTRLALPFLQSPGVAHPEFTSALNAASSSSGVMAWRFLPGMRAAAFAHIDKRQVAPIGVSITRDEGFSLNEDVLPEASRSDAEAAR